MQIELKGQDFILSDTGAIYWLNKRMLIIADAHLAKENHFRKSGIPIPSGILQKDLNKISSLADTFQPTEILFLGDMFHSEENEGLNAFLHWRKNNSWFSLKLVIGNHDILSREWYRFAGIEFYNDHHTIENIILSHDRIKHEDPEKLNLCGHIHPCIILHGIARQSLRLPCFWFTGNYGILPAFGRFTGCRSVKPLNGDKVYAVGEGEIFQIKK